MENLLLRKSDAISTGRTVAIAAMFLSPGRRGEYISRARGKIAPLTAIGRSTVQQPSPKTFVSPRIVGTLFGVPLPSDSQLGLEMVTELKSSNDLNVARMLAGTADMYPGAKAMVQAVFQARDIDPRLRELIILRSAYLLECPYEWQANVVMAKNAGCTQREIDAMSGDDVITGLGEQTDLVMLATDELTSTGTLTDYTLSKMRKAFDDVSCRKLILIAWFNLLARFLNGCRVPLEAGDKLGNRTSPLN